MGTEPLLLEYCVTALTGGAVPDDATSAVGAVHIVRQSNVDRSTPARQAAICRRTWSVPVLC